MAQDDITIDPKDLRIDTFWPAVSDDKSGTLANPAVRITHLPTGTVATYGQETDRLKNRAKAMDLLRAKLRERPRE